MNAIITVGSESPAFLEVGAINVVVTFGRNGLRTKARGYDNSLECDVMLSKCRGSEYSYYTESDKVTHVINA